MNQHTAWDAYWRDGRGGACQTDESGRYGGIVARLWGERFRQVPAGSRILDLATGNGAVIELALETLTGEQCPIELFGVDSARVRPRLDENPRPGIRCQWHAGVANESLPFEDGTFDGVTSQYGIEYGDLEKTVAETARVLRPDGWVHWICHWHEADLARDARREAEQARAVEMLDLPGKIIDLVRLQVRGNEWLPDSHRSTTGSPEAARMQAALGRAFEITGTRPGQAGGNLGLYLHNLAHLYQHREQQRVETVLEKFDACREELRHHAARLEALVAAALTPARLAVLKQALAGAGLELEREGTVVEPATGRVVGFELCANMTGPGEAARATGRGETRNRAARSDWCWSEYWRQGRLTSFDQGHFEAGYDGVVAAFWHRVFDALPDGAAMVDFATGNGAIPLLAVRRSRHLGRRWRITGLDYAAIRTPETGEQIDQVRADMGAVELKPHTPMENTGLPGACVELVTSHFGFEYGDRPRVAAEAARILTSGGRLALVMHHPESAVMARARESLRQTRICLEEENLDRKVAAAIRAEYGADPRRAAADEGRAELKRSLERLERRLAGRDASQLRAITGNYLRAVEEFQDRTEAERLAFVEQTSEALAAYVARLEAMAAAALDDEAYAGFLDQLAEAGFSGIRTGILRHDNGTLIGRTVEAELKCSAPNAHREYLTQRNRGNCLPR